MKNCRDIELQIPAYVDGESPRPERAEVDAHLSVCAPCRELAATERAAHDVLVARRGALRECASQHLKARCAALCPRTAPLYRRWVPMSVAATIVLAVTAVFALGLTERAQALAFQMTVDHMKCARLFSAPAAADPVAEGQRWRERNGWAITVPATSQPEGLELRGVRRCAVTDGRVAHLQYHWRGEPLSVFVLPGDKGQPAAHLERFGHDAVIWSQNGRTYAVLARGKARELDGVVRYVKASVY